jgi:hypothetical protein
MRTGFAALVAWGMLLAAPAVAQGPLDFTLVNRTGYTINEVYVSPVSSNDWEEDVMGRDQLEQGQRVTIQFPKRVKTCMWDLKVVYEDEDEAEWEDFNLCSTSTIVLRYDRKKDQTWAEYE